MMSSSKSASASGETRSVPMYRMRATSQNTGKTFSMTKTSVKFAWGYANYNDLANGACGNDARGEEHVMEIKWSLFSGRRCVIVDGNLMHSSQSDKSKFDFTFKMKDRNHTARILCYAAAPQKLSTGYQPHQYNLIFTNMDNMLTKSFHELPKISELEQDVDSVYAKVRYIPQGVPSTFQFQKGPSILPATPPPEEQDLISFFDDPEPVQTPGLGASMSYDSFPALSMTLSA